MKNYRQTQFDNLNGKTIIGDKISDHTPLIKNGILSWNIMMQGKQSDSGYYNTAFSLIESDDEYQSRLRHIVSVLAEIKTKNPTVTILALQEAPIRVKDIAVFREEFGKHHVLTEFMDIFNDPHLVSSWGIMTLVSSQAFTYQRCHSVWAKELYAYNDRTQMLHLQPRSDQLKFTVDLINLHMPYRQSHNDHVYVKSMMDKMLYSRLDSGIPHGLVAVGDFNVNPANLGYESKSVFCFKGSNVHLGDDGKVFDESVDAIIANPVMALVSKVGLFQLRPIHEAQIPDMPLPRDRFMTPDLNLPANAAVSLY